MRRKHIVYTTRMILSGRVVLQGHEPLWTRIRAWAQQSGHFLDIGIKDIPDSLRSINLPSNWVLEDGLLLNRTTISFVMLKKGA
jgi:hypothetical protein